MRFADISAVKVLGRSIGAVADPSEFDGDGDGFVMGRDGRDNVPAPVRAVGRRVGGRSDFASLARFGVDSRFMPSDDFLGRVDVVRRGKDGAPFFELPDDAFDVLRDSKEYKSWVRELDDLYSGQRDKDGWIKDHIDGFVKTYVNRSAFLDKFPEKASKPVDNLKKHVGDNPIVVNLGANALMSVLRDGSYKPNSEIGIRRRFIEAALFGIPMDADPSLRPIYGSIDAPDAKFSNAEAYGRFRLVLKDRVAERSMFVPQDSHGAGVREIASRVSSPSPLSSTMMDRGFWGYVEAQVFGGVNLSDVDEVVFPFTRNRSEYDDFVSVLDKKKIKWRILDDPLGVKSFTRVRFV